MGLRKIESWFVSLGLLMLIALVFLAAMLRLFGIDMSWSTDLAQLTFAWVSFIGADLALAQKRHIGVTLLIERFPKGIQKVINRIMDILVFSFLVFATVYGFHLSYVNRMRHFNTLGISYSFATLSAPVGCMLMAGTMGIHLFGSFISRKGKEAA